MLWFPIEFLIVNKLALKGIVHTNQSSERKSAVEDFCAGCMEPGLELPVRSRTRALAL